jgi:hypothetical protein
MTHRQKQAVEFLEKLVYGRESIESLNDKISKHFGEKIEVENASQGRIDSGEEDDELTDWNLMFNIEGEDNELSGFYDIYFLPMRREGFDGATMFITEIGWEFE